jgi:hypothetical protein
MDLKGKLKQDEIKIPLQPISYYFFSDKNVVAPVNQRA